MKLYIHVLTGDLILPVQKHAELHFECVFACAKKKERFSHVALLY